MATVAEPITELTELTAPAGADELCIVDDVGGGSEETKRITVTNFLGNVPVNVRIGGSSLDSKLVVGGQNQAFIGPPAASGNTSNGEMTIGLTINQEANDDEILALKSSDVGHGGTTLAEIDTYAQFLKSEGNSGGLRVRGYKDADGLNSYALNFEAWLAENVSTAKNGTAAGIIDFYGAQLSGTGQDDVVADGNVYSFRCRRGGSGVTLLLVDEDGELHLDATLSENAWDEEDDVALIEAVRHAVLSPENELKARTRDLFERHRKVLEDAGVITVNDGPGEDGSVFLAMKQWSFLLADAVRQLGTRIKQQERRLGIYEQALLKSGMQPGLLEV